MKVNFATQRKPRIELIPLIDIVFLLLVFFIYAMLSMAVHRGIPVSLPSSSTAVIEPELTLAVSVRADGRLFVNKQPVPLARLPRRLAELTRGEPDAGILLFAHRRLPYQQLFAVMDGIREAGIQRVSLQAERNDLP